MSSYAIAARAQLRSNVTRLHNDRHNFHGYNAQERCSVKLKLDRLDSELKVANEKIVQFKFSGVTNEADVASELEACELYSEKIVDFLCILQTPLPDTPNGGTVVGVRSLLKSPTAPLPRFSSTQGENLELFLSNFEETLSLYNYTDYDKLLLLKQQISGKALFLIDSLEPDRQTYNAAKELLRDALASIPLQKANVIKQMSNLKLDYKGEPFQYISEIRKIMHAVKNLKITIEDVMTYFFYHGLNETFRNQLTLVTNSVRPNLNEIIDNFFAANERYELALSNSKSKVDNSQSDKVNTTSLVSNNSQRTNPFQYCSLCSGANHPINKCDKYLKPREKIERLKLVNGCVKCGNADHIVTKCRFRFKKSCIHCSKWHFSFLCPDALDSLEKPEYGKSKMTKSDSKPNESSNENSKRISSSTIVSSFYENCSNLDSVLSTLSVKICRSTLSVDG